MNAVTSDYLPLQNRHDLDPLLEKIGDAKYVLLGEASHGTHEYYTWRAHITKRLILEKGFSFIAVEGDWPDCFEINRWIKQFPDSHNTISEVLKQFERWPTWMWANWEIAGLAAWLREYNSQPATKRKIGFYGLDVYSLWDSLEILVNYLDKEDPQTAKIAKEVADCFEPYRKNDSYIQAYRNLRQDCKNEVLNLLMKIRRNKSKYNSEPESGLNAEINSLVMANAEKYYEAMAKFDNSSWNVRDSHMVETLEILMNYHSEDAKVIVWEHNTHVGDARYTDMKSQGLFNVGQLVREKYEEEGVLLVGFGSYIGKVLAGDSWGSPMREMDLPNAKTGSVEELLHRKSPENKLLIFNPGTDLYKKFDRKMDHRAVGVVYDPDREYGNYVPTILSRRYDAFLYIDETTALHPVLFRLKNEGVPDTYPFGL